MTKTNKLNQNTVIIIIIKNDFIIRVIVLLSYYKSRYFLLSETVPLL